MRGSLGRIGVIVALALATAHSAGAATTADLLRCEKGIHSRATAFVKTIQTLLLSCATKVESCQLLQEIDGTDPTSCLASATSACGAYSGKITAYRSSALGKAALGCTALSAADADAYTAGLGFFHVSAACGTSTVTDLVGCVFDRVQCDAERSVFQLDPRAEAALATAGIAAAHPCVAP